MMRRRPSTISSQSSVDFLTAVRKKLVSIVMRPMLFATGKWHEHEVIVAIPGRIVLVVDVVDGFCYGHC